MPTAPKALENCWRTEVKAEGQSADQRTAALIATEKAKTKCLKEWPKWYETIRVANGGEPAGEKVVAK